MIDAFFAAFGNIFATGVGILLLAAVAGAMFVMWDWRVALLGAVLVHFGSSSVLVLIHEAPGLVAAGQVLAVTLSAVMLASAGFLHPHSLTLRQASNWLLRLAALALVAAAWWYLDPGYVLPSFSQPETDFLLWTAICALAMLSFSNSPLMAGAAVLLWSTPLYALAAVLLPGSGLPAIVGIADIVIALACSYLVLLEPSAARRAAGGVTFGVVFRTALAAVSARALRGAEDSTSADAPQPTASSALPSQARTEKAAEKAAA